MKRTNEGQSVGATEKDMVRMRLFVSQENVKSKESIPAIIELQTGNCQTLLHRILTGTSTTRSVVNAVLVLIKMRLFSGVKMQVLVVELKYRTGPLKGLEGGSTVGKVLAFCRRGLLYYYQKFGHRELLLIC